jgi:hypothetical protein
MSLSRLGRSASIADMPTMHRHGPYRFFAAVHESSVTSVQLMPRPRRWLVRADQIEWQDDGGVTGLAGGRWPRCQTDGPTQ